MIGKYIRCDVDPKSRQAFSSAQESWEKTSESKGFISQLGGWDANGNSAIILSIWKDEESIKSFMLNKHDAIAQRTPQSKTYNSCSTSYLDKILTIPSSSDSIFPEKECDFIRIADCQIFPDKTDDFMYLQKTVWNPGMANVNGMLGGYFWSFSSEPDRYLVTTFWKTENDHQKYMTDQFPDLKKRSRATNCIVSISGHSFIKEKKWMVLP